MQPKQPRFASKGALLMLLSAFLFAVLGLLCKLLDARYRVWDISFYRFFGSAIVLLVIFGGQQNLFRPKNLKLMLIRGMTGSMAFISIIISIRLISFSTAMVIFYSFPAFSALFSSILFNDKISKLEVVYILIALIGVVIIFDFNFEGSIEGKLMALLGGIFAGLTVSIIKELRKDHGTVIVYFFFCLMGSIIATGPFLMNPQLPVGLPEWLIIAGIIGTSTLAQLLMNRGFRYCKSWEGGLFLTTEIIFTSIFGIIFLKELVTCRFWLGGILIITSTILFNLRAKINNNG